MLDLYQINGTVATMIVSGNALSSAQDVVAAIEAAITAGELEPGARLDPVRVVAAKLGLAPNTVAAAYRTLGERGLVIGHGRRGTFVADRPPLALPLDERVADGLIDLSTGNPDPTLLPDLRAALARVEVGHALYGHAAIDPDLADLLRADLEADGVIAERMCVVGGALDGIERTLTAWLRPGDRVGIEDPGYASVTELVAAMALRPTPVAIDDRGLLPDELSAAIADGLTAVVLTPRAHNPTGAALDGDRADRLREVLAANPDVLVIEDDHAGRVAGARYHTVVPPGAARWATVRSVAKSLGPDLRLAALVGDDTTVARVAGRQALGTGWVSHLLQRTVAQLLVDRSVGQLLDRAEATYAARRSAVVDELSVGGIEVSGRSGLNVWVPVADEATVVAAMQRAGYAIRSGARFRSASAPGVRITTAGTDEMTLRNASRALLSAVTSHEATRSV